MTWLAHAGPSVSGIDAEPGPAVPAGPGMVPARSARRVNAVLAAVRGMRADAAGAAWPPVIQASRSFCLLAARVRSWVVSQSRNAIAP